MTGTLADYGNSVDNIMPLAIVRSLSPLVAGITIIGPIAASISTISSLLLTATSSIIKDIYMYEKEKTQTADFGEKNEYAQSALYPDFGTCHISDFDQSAKRDLEDQYVCVRRTGNSVLVGICSRNVLEKKRIKPVRSGRWQVERSYTV